MMITRALLVSVLTISTTTAAWAATANDTATQTSVLPKLKNGDPLPANLFVELAKAVNPAVVNIFTTYLPRGRQGPMRGNPYNDPFFELFEQFMQPPGRSAPPQQSLGTGFIIRDDGLIVTNNHVIDKADVIKVQLEERTKEVYDAKVIGKDPRTDVALIKIEAKRKLPYVRLGSSADLQVGEWVAAFGNPYGYGHTVTKGIVSAIGREIDELNLNPFIQTDASINPGNSGGPLVNTQGLVIGVNTAIDARAQGIGFVIPIDNVKAILPQLEKDGSIERGYLGVHMQDIDAEGARTLNIKETEGALITDVIEGSPADKAGLEPWDLVVEFNTRKVTSTRDLSKAVALAPVGEKVTAKVIRNGKPTSLSVTIGKTGEAALASAKTKGTKREGAKAARFGFAVADYTPGLAQEFGLPALRQPRPVVIQVEPGSEAARSGLAPGDVILDVNRRDVAKARDVIQILKPGTLNILRILKSDRVVLISIKG